MREGWTAQPCGAVLELGKPGIWGDDDPAPENEPFYCLRGVDIAALRAGDIPDAPLRYAPRAKVQPKQCAPGTLLIETSGSKCGRSVLITGTQLRAFARPVAYSNFCRLLIPDPTVVTIEFAALWLDWMYTSGTLPMWRATSAMPNLDLKGFLGGQMMLIPPLEEQRRIVDIISAIDDGLAALRETATAARTARASLLAELLSGSHDIPSSYDRLLSAA